MTDKEQLAELLMKYRDDPVRFVVEVIGAKPSSQQIQMLNAIAQPGSKVSIKSGHGCGKTSGLAWTILWFLCTHDNCRIPCTAPSSHQLNDLLWPEIVAWKDKMHPYFRSQLEQSSDFLWVKGAKATQYAVARTARPEKPEALQGFHSNNLLFVIDEASGVAEQIFEVAEGALSTPGARVIMTSNPTRTDGYFYRSQTKERKFWTCLHFSCLDSPLVSQVYPEQMAERYGIDSSVYAVRVLGEFPDSSDDTLIALSWLEDALTREVTPGSNHKIAGLDVARFGDDATALVVREGNLITHIDQWRNLDLMQTAGKMAYLYKQDKMFDYVCVDSIGLGSGVVDRLNDLGVPVVGVNVSESSAYSDKYMRLRDELWWLAREKFQDKLIGFKPGLKWVDDFIAEMSTVRYSISPVGKIIAESKNEMKKRGHDSPNLADAFNLTLYKGKQNALTRHKAKAFSQVNPGGWT